MNVTIPSGVISLFGVVAKVHTYWGTFRRVRIYTNKDNFASLISGHATNFIIGDLVPVRWVALSVLVASRVVLLVEQKNQFSKSYQRWRCCLKNEYPGVEKNGWIKKPVIFSPSTYHCFTVTFSNRVIRIKEIVFHTWQLGIDTFLLCMRMLDAIEGFSFNPELRDESVNEFFVNISTLLTKLEHEKDDIIHCLFQNKELIQTVLEKIKVPFTADNFLNLSSTAIDRIVQLNSAKKTIGGIIEYIKGCFA